VPVARENATPGSKTPRQYHELGEVSQTYSSIFTREQDVVAEAWADSRFYYRFWHMIMGARVAKLVNGDRLKTT